MRALTLTQPWASLVASGIKLVENRQRPMIARAHFGSVFAIHASREIDEVVYHRIAELAPELAADFEIVTKPRRGRPNEGGIVGRPEARALADPTADWFRLSRTTSAVIAVATLVDVLHIGGFHEEAIATEVHRAGLGDDQARWAFGPTCYVLRDVSVLSEPVPCKGVLGFWALPPDVEERIRAQLPGGGR